MSIPTPPVKFDPIELPSRYAKSIVAILTAVITVIVAALGDGVVSTAELAQIGIAFLTAFGVYAVPNIQDQTVGAWAKALVAVLGTALQALIPFLLNGEVTNAQWLMVFLAALGALAVGIVPNVDPAKVAAQQAVVQAPIPTTVVVNNTVTDPVPVAEAAAEKIGPDTPR